MGALIENNPHFRTFSISQDVQTNHYIVDTYLNPLIDETSALCSPSNNFQFLENFSDESVGLNEYVDKYRYLEQSRKSFLQAISQIRKAASSGNAAAQQLDSSESLNKIAKGMNDWSGATHDSLGIRNHCIWTNPDRSHDRSPQSAFWDERKYQNLSGIEDLLNQMKAVTTSSNRFSDHKKFAAHQCNGQNTNEDYYLAYPESHFLSLLQDWLESYDDHIFEIGNIQPSMSYRSCVARLAAHETSPLDHTQNAAEYPIDISVSVNKSH